MSLDFVSEGSGGNVAADSINLQGAFEGATMSLQSLIPGASLAPLDHSQDMAAGKSIWVMNADGKMVLPNGSGGPGFTEGPTLLQPDGSSRVVGTDRILGMTRKM